MDRLLIIGLIVCNLLFAVYIGFLVATSKRYSEMTNNEERMSRISDFVTLEFACWVVDSISYMMLLISAAYTIRKLRTIFGKVIDSEANRMFLIMFTFIAAFGIKTAY